MSLESNHHSAVAEGEENLFRPSQPMGFCVICALLLRSDGVGQTHLVCCGKIICNGCVFAMEASNVTVGTATFHPPFSSLCPFCRAPKPTSASEFVTMLRKRADANDPWAIYNLACAYFDGNIVPQDDQKAVELWIRAGELGCALGHNKLAIAYRDGRGVEADITQAEHHYKQAAIGGITGARHELGCLVQMSGDKETAMRHWLISAGDGNDFSLAVIKDSFKRELVTKDNFERALRDNNNAKDEMKSDAREAAGEIVAIRKNFLTNRTCCVPPKTPRKTLKVE